MKKALKKLRLQKETLSVLNGRKLAQVQGGESAYCSYGCTHNCTYTFFSCVGCTTQMDNR